MIFSKSYTKCEEFSKFCTKMTIFSPKSVVKFTKSCRMSSLRSISFVESISDSFSAFRQLYDDFWATSVPEKPLFHHGDFVKDRPDGHEKSKKIPGSWDFFLKIFRNALLVSTSSSETYSFVAAVFNYFPAYPHFRKRDMYYFASYRRNFLTFWHPYLWKILGLCWAKIFG